MAGTRIVTKKMVSWHGRMEEFSNVYYFGDGAAGLSPSEAEATALIDAVIAAERSVSSVIIDFLGGAAYRVGIADGPGDTDAIATRELPADTEGLIGGAVPTINPEMALDVKFLLGGRRYLRTMIHCGVSHGCDPQSREPTPSAAISQVFRDYAQKMLNGPWPGGYQRIAPNGDRPTVVQHNPFLEHRQFHRYRKRNAGLLG